MSETTNLKLKKHDNPETNEDLFDIENYLNGNWDKIDDYAKGVNNFETEINQKIEDIQALPVGGTKGQVLTKQSETDGDANWEDIEANEVHIGNEEEAPETAKIIVEEDDFKESSTLSKAEVYVGAEKPTTGEKVWLRKGKNYLDISKLKSRTSYGITLTPTNTGIKISGTATDTYAYGEKISIALKKGIKYTLSGKNAGNILKIALLKQDASTIIMNVKTVNDEITFIPTEDVFYIQFILESITKGTTYDYEISNLQIEQGLKTSYEDYIEQKIYVRNSNGVYEEFSKQEDTGWINGTTIGNENANQVRYRKVGNIVYISSMLYLKELITVNGMSNYNLFTLPDSFRPAFGQRGTISVKGTDNIMKEDLMYQINTNGEVSLFNSGTSNVNVICAYFSLSYPV